MNAHSLSNSSKSLRKQNGFFDFGIGLALLTLFGTTAYVVTPEVTSEKHQQVASCKDDSRTPNSHIKDCSKLKEKY